MGNPMLDRFEAEKTVAMQVSERVTRQYDQDTFQIALNRYGKVKLGYQRIMEITELWEQVRREYEDAIKGGVEADVARHHLDAELLQIAKDEARIIAFEERYPEMREIRYDRKNAKKGRKS